MTMGYTKVRALIEYKNHKATSIAFNLLIFFASVYLLTSSGGSDYTVDTGRVRYEVTRSIMEKADLAIPSGLGVKGSDGRDYSWFGLGQSLLSIPFYLAGKYAGTNPMLAVSMMNQLIGAATAVLVFLFSNALGYSKRASLLVSLFYGLGTIAWHYTKSACDHPAETFFILLSTYFMCRYSAGKNVPYLYMSAFSMGAALLTRPYSVLAIPALLIMPVVVDWKSCRFNGIWKSAFMNALQFLSALIPFAAVALWYNHYRFGSPFETGYGLIAARTGLDFFTGTPLTTGLAGFLASPGKGFFYYSPVTFLFFFSIRAFFRKHPGPAACFILLSISYLLFLSKNIYWHGDFAWGPRYLLPITPYLVLPLAELLDSPAWLPKSFPRKAVHSLFALSVLIQLAAVSVDGTRYFISLQTDRKIRFTQADGAGVQPIREPPIEVYFNWRLSPIAAQFGFVYETASGIKDYKFTRPGDDATPLEAVKAAPYMHIFDFWWLYQYFMEGSGFGLMTAALLSFLAFCSALRVRNIVHDS